MWLLSTSRAELKYFVSPESVGGYAILSHVWNEAEQSHQDIQALRTLCAQTGQNPRDLASDKIRHCCELAERHGYLWVWIDTCCIDKTSSAELSEAINSMFRYYALADVCYAYLEDVPSSASVRGGRRLRPCADRDPFVRSRWHSRGWTLQELLAPRLLLFVSRSWDVLGSKSDKADILERRSGIPAAVLRFEQQITDVSIAQRMAWAAARRTTRAEDEAYCLMGIFGVNIPIVYGEGRAAFQRLQEEILRRHADTTLFAWGRTVDLVQLTARADAANTRRAHDHVDGSSLFATSPAAFAGSRNIIYAPLRCPAETSSGESMGGVPTFSVTPHGVQARIRVIECDGVTVADLSWRVAGRSRSLAHEDTVPLGLVLTPCFLSADLAGPLYDVGAGSGSGPYARLARLRLPVCGPQGIVPGEGLEESSDAPAPAHGTWRDVYLANRPSLGPGDGRSPANTDSERVALPVDSGFNSPFRFRQLQGRALDISPENVILCSVSELPRPWTGITPMVLRFRATQWPYYTFDVILGRCTVSGDHSPPHAPGEGGDGDGGGESVGLRFKSASRLGPHWATVRFLRGRYPSDGHWPEPTSASHEHDCAQDHICDWPGGVKTFESVAEESSYQVFFYPRPLILYRRSVSVSFSPCPLNPVNAYLVDLGCVGGTIVGDI